MRIGIISDSELFIPLAYTLAARGLPVYLYYSSSADAYVNQNVREFVGQFHVPFREERDQNRDLYEWLNNGMYDVCFVVGYKYLIDLSRLQKCVTQLFNIHFGTLPSFMGPVPVFWQLKQGVSKVGLSIHRVSDKFDAGDVVWVKETENKIHYNFRQVSQLFSQLCVEGAVLIIQCLLNRMPVLTIDRSSFVRGYQKRPGLDDVLIRWEAMTSVEIYNLIRACNPWNKGGICMYHNQEVKLMDATVMASDGQCPDSEAGTIVGIDGELLLQCVDGHILKTNMLFFQDSFIPAYQCSLLGFKKGEKLL